MFYNCHIHTFTEPDIPRRYLPLGLVRFLSTTWGFKTMSRLLNTLNPYSDDDTLHRYQRFIEIGKNRKQTEIFEEYCEPFYPDDTRFVVLAMDMAFMGAGKVPHSYIGQLDELTELKNKYSQRDVLLIFLLRLVRS